MAQGPKILFIGDDFTGASDTLATFSRKGLAAELFLDPPRDFPAAGPVGLATALRALSPADIVSQIEHFAPALMQYQPDVVHYKVCSTFDSAPDVGSIGAAVTALRAVFDPALVLVIGGQPSLGRYCLFGTLFAADSRGKIHRIDRHPVMQNHPVTPMGEADLTRHLQGQGLALRAVPYTDYTAGSASLAAQFQKAVMTQEALLLDAGQSADLITIGAALNAVSFKGRPILIVGASSVAEALTAQVTNQPPPPIVPKQPAPVFAFAGSRSSVTAEQVAQASMYKPVPLPPEVFLNPAVCADLIASVAQDLTQGISVLAHLLPNEDYALSPQALAHRSVKFVTAVLSDKKPPIAGLAIAGGDTSSMICHALNLRSLTYLHDMDPGVSLCLGHSKSRASDLVMMLKGGQVGRPDLFNRFLAEVTV